MKVLFICVSNVGRSQMAAEFYDQLTGTQDAASAGVKVEIEGETLQQRRDRNGGGVYVVDAMNEKGVDVRDNVSTQVTPGMLEQYDQVINIAGEAFTPKWLSDHTGIINWTIDDPGGKGLEETIVARDLVKAKVIDFIKNGR